MADAMPDYHVEQQRLTTDIAALRHNLERYKLEIMEMESRKKKALGNIEATEKAIAENHERLKGLIETHGEADSNAKVAKAKKEVADG